MDRSNKTVCIVGASGFAGSHIVREALARGYRVHATMRDKDATDKAPYLMALEGAAERLTLFSAEMMDEQSFDAPFAGVDGIFIACLIPVYAGPSGKLARDMDDDQGYAEIIMPTVTGCLNILRAAVTQKVKNVVICSSTSSTNPIPAVAFKNELDHWSDPEEQCRAKKYTSATKTVMERAAMEFSAEHGQRLSIILPTGMYGPVLLPEHMLRSPHQWLKTLIEEGTPKDAKIPNDSSSMIHLQDLAALFLAAYENPTASGRYFGVYDSWHLKDIYDELKRLLPDMKMPAPLDEDPVPATSFDFTRRDSLGVPIRDIPTILRETIDFIKTNPFP